MIGALSSLAMPGIGGALGGGGGGLSSSQSSSASTGPVDVNPNVQSKGSGSRGVSNVVAFPGSRIDGPWAMNEPREAIGGISNTLILAILGSVVLVVLVVSLKRR